VGVVVTLVVFIVWAWWTPWRPGRAGGLAFGIAAALLFLNAALYPARRRLRTWPWGTSQHWLQLHVYGSVLAAWFVLLHTGFRLPAGQFGWWLWSLSLWTSASGVAGVVIQKWIPAALARSVRTEAIYERIPELVARLRAKAEALVEGAPDALAQLYGGEIKPMLATSSPRWSYVVAARVDGATPLTALRSLREFVGDDQRERLDGLETIVREKLELDVQASAQRVLRGWLVIHVPPAMLLMALLAVHIIAVLLY
jgi:hypothetical protein